MANEFTVTIQVSPVYDEQEVYFCNEVHTEIEIIELFGEANGDPVIEKIKWVVFVPNNGRNHGKLMRVPFDRLLSIAEKQDRTPNDDAGY